MSKVNPPSSLEKPRETNSRYTSDHEQQLPDRLPQGNEHVPAGIIKTIMIFIIFCAMTALASLIAYGI